MFSLVDGIFLQITRLVLILENLGACAGKMSASVLIFVSSSRAGPKSGNLQTLQCLQLALLLLISRRCRWKRGLLQIPVL